MKIISDKHTHEISVSTVTDYIPDQSLPGDRRYVFSYTISITNNGTVPATLLRRHWIITDANNKVQEVHGDGVVGEQPYLLPGETYKYTSGAMLETPIGCMEGNYDMLADDGVEFEAVIPVFSLKVPNTLH
jgi:ApaG protein